VTLRAGRAWGVASLKGLLASGRSTACGAGLFLRRGGSSSNARPREDVLGVVACSLDFVLGHGPRPSADYAFVAELLAIGVVMTELCQDLVGVLAQQRREAANCGGRDIEVFHRLGHL